MTAINFTSDDLLNLGELFPDLTKHKIVNLGGVIPNAYSIVIAEISKLYDGLVVVLVEDFNTAYALEEELITFIPKEEILHFPDWETLPFDNISPHSEIISTRLATLYRLPKITKGILIVPIVTLMHRICPVEYIHQEVLLLQVNTNLDLDNFLVELTQAGYIKVPQVTNHGEFAVRGSIIDLFPNGADLPYRIDLLDCKIDSIRIFTPENQRTKATSSEIKILPAQEYPFNHAAIKKFRTNWRTNFTAGMKDFKIYQEVSANFKSPGLEYYLPLFFDRLGTLFDYLPQNAVIIKNNNCGDAALNFWNLIQDRLKQCRDNENRPILAVEQLFLNCTEVFSCLKKFTQIICNQDLFAKTNHHTHNLKLNVLPNQLEEFCTQSNVKKLFCVESKGRKEIFRQCLAKKNYRFNLIDVASFNDFISRDLLTGLMVSSIEKGFYLPKLNLALITETDLFPYKLKQIKRKRETTVESSLRIKNLIEIDLGDPIVHLEYGIGRYRGLIELNYSGIAGEFVVIEYAENNKLYVPITNLNVIHRYSGVDLTNAPLHKLGNDKWAKEKQKASKQIKDLAAQLLEIYAIRANKNKAPYIFNENNYQKFINSFAFEDTPDQHKASLDIINDLTKDKPMDRVVCGDVGFGKTEIAMRAAFIAADNSYQIVVLAPTTLLAQQHYQNFLDRFADFPINIELLSRFTDNKQHLIILEKISKGTCDIIIGTHRLLQQDLKFKRLGLLIIDEEHRFGVEQKEIFKKYRADLNILSLTATPIPRTLNMAISGIRDLSIIATPPNNRLAVKTFVREYSLGIIKEAILRELQRGGQVYYLHNEIDTINATATKIQDLIPHALIKIAHGQMPKRELQKIMVDFYHRKFNILICTTIIESGIDQPNANTIIIPRADCYGLSQLHQLRGRVGRSNHQAYAFCFVNARANLTPDAIKRLDALESLTTLGTGFTLATHDLEIRGSGELLGNDQSGNIQTIGFDLYAELLEHAINYLKNNNDLHQLETDVTKSLKFEQTEIDLQLPAFIPSNYIPDLHTRFVFYKNLNSIKNVSELQDLMLELIDRFGTLPVELKNLSEITQLKLKSQQLGVKQIKLKSKSYNIEFSNTNCMDLAKLVNLLEKQPNKFKLINHDTTNSLIILEKIAPENRVDYIEKLLEDLKM